VRRTIKTKSGSVYEIDTENKTIHRVSGGSHYTGRANGTPAVYEDISTPTVGKPLVIYWGYGSPDEYSPDDGGGDRGKCTYTSPVTEVE
jgi:hypothetical protein